MYLGIEIGGTKLQVGVGRGDGSAFVGFERRDVDISQGAAGILAQIDEAGTKLLAKHRIKQVGFGFGGPVDTEAGRVIKSHQVDGWEEFPLTAWCEERLGVSAILGNDCDCAALAEARFGAGQGRRLVFFVTVGTGIGGGLVVGGELQGSGRPAVAEIGHLRPDLEATDPESTVESLAAGPAIEAAARSRIKPFDDSDSLRRDLLGDKTLEQLTAKSIGEAAARGNWIARKSLREATRALGWGIAQVITLTSAEVVVVGGGISLIGEELFFNPLREQVSKYVFPPLAGSFEIVPARLGEDVVVHGALALAAEASPK
jgi:glucokinase